MIKIFHLITRRHICLTMSKRFSRNQVHLTCVRIVCHLLLWHQLCSRTSFGKLYFSTKNAAFNLYHSRAKLQVTPWQKKRNEKSISSTILPVCTVDLRHLLLLDHSIKYANGRKCFYKLNKHFSNLISYHVSGRSNKKWGICIIFSHLE